MAISGFLKISGRRGTPIPVPEGRWKLLSYTIDLTDRPEAAKAAEKAAAKKAAEGKKGSLWAAMAAQLGAVFGGSLVRPGPVLRWFPPRPPVRIRRSRSSRGRRSSCPSARRTGPWWEPISIEDGNESQAVLVGHVAGRLGRRDMQHMMVDGGKPPKPEFTITDAKGKVIDRATSSMAEVSPAGTRGEYHRSRKKNTTSA